MLKYLILFILLQCNFFVKGQDNPGTFGSGMIGGVVTDEAMVPLDKSAVSIIRSDSLLQKEALLTGADGVFFFDNLDTGYYTILISYVGYAILRIDSIHVRNERNDFNLGEIKLSRAATEMVMVTVYAEKPLYENKDGKLIFNASESALSNSASATDLLKQTPLVNVDADGKVLLRGKEVKILIDEKPVDMDSRQLQDLLESMSGSMIEKIEVLTTPPPQYANERGGVINIVTKKGKAGINGRINSNYGTRGEAGLHISGSYRKKTLAINLSAGITQNEYTGNSFSNRQNIYTDSTNFFRTKGENNNNNLRPVLRLTIDHDLNKYNSINLSSVFNSSSSNSTASTEYKNINRFDNVYRYSSRDVESDADNISQSVNLSYTMKTRNPREVLRIIAGLNVNLNNNGRGFYQQFIDPATFTLLTDSFQQQNTNIRNHSVNLRTSYDRPLKNKKLSVSTGVNYSYFTSHNILSSMFMKKPEYVYVQNDLLSNDLRFFQNVTGIRGSLRYDIIQDFYINGGLLYEYTLTDFVLVNAAGKYRNNYSSTLPFLTIMKKWKSGLSITGSYKRTVQRPGINHLNPSVDYSDPYNLRFGNPFLKPYYADNYDLILGFWHKKYSFNLSGGYNSLTDIYSSIRMLQSDGKTNVTWENISSRKEYELHFWGNLTVSKKIKLNVSSGYTYNIYSLRDRTARKFRNGGSLNSSLNGNYHVNPLLNATTSISYNRFANPQGRTRNTLSMNIGVQQKFLKKNLTVSLNMIDPFTQQNNKNIVYGNGYILENTNITQTKNFRIAVAYLLKKQVKKKQDVKMKKV